MSSSTLTIHVEFQAGLELCFDDVKKHTLDVPTQQDGVLTVSQLVQHLRSLVTKREDFFIQSDTLRPGILVLINDVDYEVAGGLDAELEDKDTVVFLSTLHGG